MASRAEERELGPGWRAVLDPGSGQTFYANVGSGASQWEMPAELAGRGVSDEIAGWTARGFYFAETGRNALAEMAFRLAHAEAVREAALSVADREAEKRVAAEREAWLAAEEADALAEWDEWLASRTDIPAKVERLPTATSLVKSRRAGLCYNCASCGHSLKACTEPLHVYHVYEGSHVETEEEDTVDEFHEGSHEESEEEDPVDEFHVWYVQRAWAEAEAAIDDEVPTVAFGGFSSPVSADASVFEGHALSWQFPLEYISMDEFASEATQHKEEWVWEVTEDIFYRTSPVIAAVRVGVG
jgi:hypothetical protein